MLQLMKREARASIDIDSHDRYNDGITHCTVPDVREPERMFLLVGTSHGDSPVRGQRNASYRLFRTKEAAEAKKQEIQQYSGTWSHEIHVVIVDQ